MVDLQRLHTAIELGKDTFTKEEVFALLTGVMGWRLRFSAQEEQYAMQAIDHEEQAEHRDRSNMNYDEADGIRYALMEFGMDFDQALALRDKLHDEARALVAEEQAQRD